jgi:hypothetical protein
VSVEDSSGKERGGGNNGQNRLLKIELVFVRSYLRSLLSLCLQQFFSFPKTFGLRVYD